MSIPAGRLPARRVALLGSEEVVPFDWGCPCEAERDQARANGTMAGLVLRHPSYAAVSGRSLLLRTSLCCPTGTARVIMT
jgi:hypothetical protein